MRALRSTGSGAWRGAVLVVALAAATAAGCIQSRGQPGPSNGRAGRSLEPAVPHPLDPLSEDDIKTAASVLRSSRPLSASTLFPVVALNEPPKEEVLRHRPGGPMRREALVQVLDRQANRTWEAVVDLTSRKLLEWREIRGGQPLVTWAEFDTVPSIVRADSRWQEAMRRRGIMDLDKVHIDVWAPGYQGNAPASGSRGVRKARGARRAQGERRARKEPEARDAGGARVVRAISFYRGDQRNGYGRPVEGVIARVDLNRLAVIEVTDAGVVPLARNSQDLDTASPYPLRPRPRPLRVVQPEGPSFAVKGHEVSWDRWRFRYAVHPREGLVLYQVGYQDRDSVRSVLYRASVSEMVVPYGDPDRAWSWRSAFDEGEYGLGKCMTSLQRGGDVPEHAMLLDAVMADETGAVEPLPAAVGLYERDGGVLWKHFDEETGQLDVRRAQELVLVNWVTIGNYDYGFHWIFRQDGSLTLDLELAGILLAKGVNARRCTDCSTLAKGPSDDQTRETRYGVLVGENVLAPNHQHFVNVRLDFDVDGPVNSVLEMNAKSLAPGPGNAMRNAVVMEKKVLANEHEARRDVSMTSARKWEVFNPDRSNALGHLSGYMLMPGENSICFAGPQSPMRRRAGFVDHHVWVTRQKRGELYAGGDYPNQGTGGGGLPRFSEREPLVATDLVLWYTFGVTHAARPEEWPVMPVHRTGFRLAPRGFFDRNPALDVAPADTLAAFRP